MATLNTVTNPVNGALRSVTNMTGVPGRLPTNVDGIKRNVTNAAKGLPLFLGAYVLFEAAAPMLPGSGFAGIILVTLVGGQLGWWD